MNQREMRRLDPPNTQEHIILVLKRLYDAYGEVFDELEIHGRDPHQNEDLLIEVEKILDEQLPGFADAIT